jgi:hypothetical protein
MFENLGQQEISCCGGEMKQENSQKGKQKQNQIEILLQGL